MSASVKSDGRVNALLLALCAKGFGSTTQAALDSVLGDHSKLRQCRYRTLCRVQAEYTTAFGTPFPAVHRRLVSDAKKSPVLRRFGPELPLPETAADYATLCAAQYEAMSRGQIDPTLHKQMVAAYERDHQNLVEPSPSKPPHIPEELLALSAAELMAELTV